MPYPFLQPARRFVCLFCIFTLLAAVQADAQVKWDGDAGDGQWNTALNWVGNQLPAATDDVLLDNSVVGGNYTVSLPPASGTVTVRTLTISPAGSSTIQLLLPASNTAAPAFIATGPGYGIVINKGGLLLNSSTASSGAAISVGDSIQVNNGGQYTHNTRSAHAALVTVLSKQPGTEQGIFKFDAPGNGYTFASTNRTYGTLVLSAAASGGNVIYASSAANPFTISGDLVIEPGVTVNLDITAATVIKGNYLQQGGVFNLASQANNNTVYLKGDLIQKAGVITETSTGLPSIELNGTVNQRVEVDGNIANSVGLIVNNAAGIILQSNLLLPYKLSLLNGIVTTQSFLLTLLAGCSIAADSTSGNSFVNGMLRKEGLSATPYFLFPVGKGSTQRWIELKNATGNYNAEFFKVNPHSLSAVTGTGIHHFSTIEYWAVATDAAPSASASLELSFDNVNSGGVTDPATLRVAQLQAGVWMDAGNSAGTGSAGAAGSVVSNPIGSFQPAVNYFTLASTDAFQNPLPVKLVSFNAVPAANAIAIKWSVQSNWHPAFFELESSEDGRHFVSVARIPTNSDQLLYEYNMPGLSAGSTRYRLKVTEADQSVWYSNQIESPQTMAPAMMSLQPTLVTTNTQLNIFADAGKEIEVNIFTIEGRLTGSRLLRVTAGNNHIPINTDYLRPGMYIITVYDGHTLNTIKFVKVG